MNPEYIYAWEQLMRIFRDVHVANRMAQVAVAYWMQEERRG